MQHSRNPEIILQDEWMKILRRIESFLGFFGSTVDMSTSWDSCQIKCYKVLIIQSDLKFCLEPYSFFLILKL